jgi:hypothetical protein
VRRAEADLLALLIHGIHDTLYAVTYGHHHRRACRPIDITLPILVPQVDALTPLDEGQWQIPRPMNYRHLNSFLIHFCLFLSRYYGSFGTV